MEKDFQISKKVRLIEIKTRRLTDATLAGQYHSAFKGRGMTFSEVREYGYGDDLRSIDWNVTARFNHPFVKVFEEERELTVILLIDVSGSNMIGSLGPSKNERIAELAGTLAFSALGNNDKVGVVFFSDRIEKFIPPKKGHQHILRIIRELITFKPEGQGTNVSAALEFFNNVIRRRSIVFCISDFIDNGYEKAFAVTARKHDLVALRISDPIETQIPGKTLFMARDSETGLVRAIDPRGSSGKAYRAWWKHQQQYLINTAARFNIDVVEIQTDVDYVKPLAQLFKRREKRV
ncbi:MAG: DUF58 domain-containing protein [Bacteroidetes bacterium HGW-Bacteroidetes-6]|jgi:uncharacterized protein (DUF58 family)|nr:MAG: DUF58 domain-containing protein [Bacteroidetes bacterium HGW-Bacteroidetes-6]